MTKHSLELADAGYGHAGSRLTATPPAAFVNRAPLDVAAILPAVHRYDLAHVVTLHDAELIPADSARTLLSGLQGMEAEGVVPARLAAGGGIHSGERYLTRRMGDDIGGLIHLGRSSGDLTAVSVRLTMRERLTSLLGVLLELRRAFLDRARREIGTIMPAYTHGQQAQPSTLAHWLCLWLGVLDRDSARILALLERSDESPAGAAAICGTDFPLDRLRTAALLGFARTARNTFDAVHSHDLELEALSVVSILAADVARFADDVLLWSSSEYAFLELPDRYSATSSILAQKKNPLLPAIVKSTASRSVGALMSGFYLNKGPSATAIMDQAAGSREELWYALDALLQQLPEVAGFVADFTANRERMREALARGWSFGADLAGFLVQQLTIPWRSAHQIVGITVRECLEAGIAPDAITSEIVERVAQEYLGTAVRLDPGEMRAAIDPMHSVERHDGIGGPAPAAVGQSIDYFGEQLRQDETRLQALRAARASADELLERAVASIIAA